jgi:AmpD protein
VKARRQALVVDAEGWVNVARRVPSPNFNARPANCLVELLVLHNISLPPGRYGGGYIEQLFTNRLDHAAHPYFDGLRGLEVSAHFLIDRAGVLTQFVSCGQRAWHAGVSEFEGRANCNDFSIGVELEGCDAERFEPAQYRMLARLARCLFAAYPLRAVRGHSDIAPGRKTDPGPRFSWRRFARESRLEPRLLPAAPGTDTNTG